MSGFDAYACLGDSLYEDGIIARGIKCTNAI